MALKMEYFNIKWVHWKIHFLGGRGGKKTLIYRGHSLKSGAWTVFKFKRGWLGKKEGNTLYVDS